MTKDKALRLALEALENHCGNYKLDDAGCERGNKAVAAIKEALAPTSTQCEVQDELCSSQEPVAYLVTGPYEKQAFTDINSANSYCNGLNKGFGEAAYSVSLLYTTPQKRPWVGLTEDEIIAVDMHTLRVRGDGYTYARAIEAKLKEKNNGN